MPEPPPVRLVAVGDVTLQAPSGYETALDDFYVGLLGFEPERADGRLVYKAANARLRIELVERVEHDTFRPVQIVVESLGEVQQKLIDAQMPCTWTKGLSPGTESVILLDPAGNWVVLMEHRRV